MELKMGDDENNTLKNPIMVGEDKEVDLAKFYEEFNERLESIYKGIEVVRNAKECVDLTRTALAVLSGANRNDIGLEVIKYYNNYMDTIADAMEAKSCGDFSVIYYCLIGEDSELAKKRLTKEFVPKILRIIKRDEQYEGLSEVSSEEGTDKGSCPRVYRTKDNHHYLIAAEEVNPKAAGLEKAVSESQKLIRIPKPLADSIFHL